MKTVNIPPSYIYGVILKSTTYIIVCVLLFGFSSAANKSISELGKVQIEDLFYNSESTLIPADSDNFEFQEFNENLMNNEEFELESLEISDIDISTFGEYENFLNKYYDENFIDINSRFIRQIELNLSTISGISFPFSKNISNRFSSGTSFGIIYNSKLRFNVHNIESHLTLEASYTNLPTLDIYFSNLKMMKFNIGISSKLLNLINSKVDSKTKHNLNSQISLGVINSSSTHSTWYVNEELSNWGLTGNVDLTYIYEFKYLSAGIKFRGQSILIGSLSPPSIGDGTNELFEMNFILSKPLHLIY